MIAINNAIKNVTYLQFNMLKQIIYSYLLPVNILSVKM